MPLILRYFVFTLAALISTFSIANPDTTCTSLTATGNAEYPPYLWRKNDGKGTLLGANQIIIDELGKRLNLSIQLQDVGSWARAQEMLKKGHTDMIAGAFYTAPRTQYMDYIHPAFLNTTSVVWKKKGSALQFKSKRDLIGKSGTTVINNSFGQTFDEFAKDKLNLEYVASLQQAFKMVAHDRADYALYEKHPGLAYANHWGFSEQIEALEPAISSEGLYLTISQYSNCNNNALRDQLAKATQEMLAEGFMQKALKQGLKDWKAFNQ